MKKPKIKIESFKEFLSSNGAEVLEPTNQYEVVRFKAGGVTSVVYQKESGEQTFTGESKAAVDAFRSGKPWRAQPRPPKFKKSTPVIQKIRARDGGFCFFCCKPVTIADESVEHLVASTHGGPNHISNLFLTHRDCNAKAGHLSAPEKIAIHVAAMMKGVVTCQ